MSASWFRTAKLTNLRFPLRAWLRDRRTNAKVRAVIDPMAESDVQLWTEWFYDTTQDEDFGWDWEAIRDEALASKGRLECYALRVEGVLEGLTAFDLEGHSTSEGQGLVIDYLASNPKNRRGAAGVAQVMLAFVALAVRRSEALGWKGRIWLESLQGAEGMYGHFGFQKLTGRSKDGHSMFELVGDDIASVLATAKQKKVVVFRK